MDAAQLISNHDPGPPLISRDLTGSCDEVQENNTEDESMGMYSSVDWAFDEDSVVWEPLEEWESQVLANSAPQPVDHMTRDESILQHVGSMEDHVTQSTVSPPDRVEASPVLTLNKGELACPTHGEESQFHVSLGLFEVFAGDPNGADHAEDHLRNENLSDIKIQYELDLRCQNTLPHNFTAAQDIKILEKQEEEIPKTLHYCEDHLSTETENQYVSKKRDINTKDTGTKPKVKGTIDNCIINRNIKHPDITPNTTKDVQNSPSKEYHGQLGRNQDESNYKNDLNNDTNTKQMEKITAEYKDNYITKGNSLATEPKSHTPIQLTYAQQTAKLKPTTVHESNDLSQITSADCAVMVERLQNTNLDIYCKAIERQIGPNTIQYLGRAPGDSNKILAFVKTPNMAEQLVYAGINVKGRWLMVYFKKSPATRVTLSDVMPYIPDTKLVEVLEIYGKVVYPNMRKIRAATVQPEFRKILSFRRETYVILREDVELPDSFELEYEGERNTIAVSTTGVQCYKCSKIGHTATYCQFNQLTINNKEAGPEAKRNEINQHTNVGLITTTIDRTNTNVEAVDDSIKQQARTNEVGGDYDPTLLRDIANARKGNVHTENKDRNNRNEVKVEHNVKVTEKGENKIEEKSNTLNKKEGFQKQRGHSKHNIEINLTDKSNYKEGQTDDKVNITEESIGGREAFQKFQNSKRQQGNGIKIPTEVKDSKKEQNVKSQNENGKDAMRRNTQKKENQTKQTLTEVISNILCAPQDMNKATALGVRGPINPQTSAHIASKLIEETKYKSTVTKNDIIKCYLKRYPRLLEHLETAMEHDTITYATDQYQYKKMVDLITSTEQISNKKQWEMRTRINHDRDVNMEFLASMQNKRKIDANGSTEVIENGTKEDHKRKKATGKSPKKDK